jgi:hypothetical protein
MEEAGAKHTPLSAFRLVPLNTFVLTLYKWQRSNANNTWFTEPAFDLSGGTCYLSQDRLSGFRLVEGELTCVFSYVKGRGDLIVQEAITKGATKLNHFESDHLSRLYMRHGFELDTIEPNWGGPTLPSVVYRELKK